MKTVVEARWVWFSKVMLVCFLALFLFSYDLEACLGVLVLGLVIGGIGSLFINDTCD